MTSEAMVLYQYYPNKQSLLFAVLEHHMNYIAARVEAACESACYQHNTCSDGGGVFPAGGCTNLFHGPQIARATRAPLSVLYGCRDS